MGARFVLFVHYFSEGPSDTCMPAHAPPPTHPQELKHLWPSCSNTLG